MDLKNWTGAAVAASDCGVHLISKKVPRISLQKAKPRISRFKHDSTSDISDTMLIFPQLCMRS